MKHFTKVTNYLQPQDLVFSLHFAWIGMIDNFLLELLEMFPHLGFHDVTPFCFSFSFFSVVCWLLFCLLNCWSSVRLVLGSFHFPSNTLRQVSDSIYRWFPNLYLTLLLTFTPIIFSHLPYFSTLSFVHSNVFIWDLLLDRHCAGAECLRYL